MFVRVFVYMYYTITNGNRSTTNTTSNNNRNARRDRYHSETEQSNSIKTFKWPKHNLLQTRSESGSETLTSSKARRQRFGTVNRLENKNNKKKSNAYSKSTYLIDINRSSDSDSTNSGGSFGRYDQVYFNNYNSRIHSKDPNPNPNPNQKHNDKLDTADQFAESVKEDEKMIHESMSEQDNVGFEREDFFGNTQEIITFAEEGKFIEIHIVNSQSIIIFSIIKNTRAILMSDLKLLNVKKTI